MLQLTNEDQKQYQGYQLSHVMRKPAFCICENKCADQLRSNCAAYRCLCFRYIDNTMPLLPKFKISSLYSFSVTVQPGLCQKYSETGFLVSWLNMQLITVSRSDVPRFVHICQLFKRFPLQPIQCYVKVETLA